MGCGASKPPAGHAYTPKKSRSRAHLRGEGEEDAGSRTSSDGVVASESPMALRLRQKLTVFGSFVAHGISSDVDQFEAPVEDVSEVLLRKVEDWVDEQLQHAVRHLVADASSIAPCKTAAAAAAADDESAPADVFDASSRAFPAIERLVDIPAIAYFAAAIGQTPASDTQAPGTLPLGFFLLTNAAREKLVAKADDRSSGNSGGGSGASGVGLTDSVGRGDASVSVRVGSFGADELRSPVSTSVVANVVAMPPTGGESNTGSDATAAAPGGPLRSTPSFMERALTTEHVKHHCKVWAKIAAMHREEIRGELKSRRRRVLTVDALLHGALFTTLEPLRQEAILSSFIDSLNATNGSGAAVASSPPGSPVRPTGRSASTSTATINCGDVDNVDNVGSPPQSIVA